VSDDFIKENIFVTSNDIIIISFENPLMISNKHY